MELFTDARSARGDAGRLLDWVDEILQGDDDGLGRRAARALSNAPLEAARRVRDARLPIVGFTACCALLMVVTPKDFAAGKVRAAIELLGPDEPAVHSAWPLALGQQLTPTLRDDRPQLWRHRARAPVVEALCMAFDVHGAASHAALARLGKIADAHAESPAIQWLDEVSCRLAHEPARAQRRAAMLDALLGGAKLGRNATALASVIGLARERHDAGHAEWHGAWLRLAATQRTPGIDVDDDDSPYDPAQLAQIRRAAEDGDEKARLLLMMDETVDEVRDGERAFGAHEGPFRGFFPEAEVTEVLDTATWALLYGFRQVYGLEILSWARPQLAAAIGRGSA